jgi:electron transfer flavoprotein beta subunit
VIAERLDVPERLAHGSDRCGIRERDAMTDAATVTVSALCLPSCIVTEALPDARFPNFKGIMAANGSRSRTCRCRTWRRCRRCRDRAPIMIRITKSPARGGREDRRRRDAGRSSRFLIANRLV